MTSYTAGAFHIYIHIFIYDIWKSVLWVMSYTSIFEHAKFFPEKRENVNFLSRNVDPQSRGKRNNSSNTRFSKLSSLSPKRKRKILPLIRRLFELNCSSCNNQVSTWPGATIVFTQVIHPSSFQNQRKINADRTVGGPNGSLTTYVLKQPELLLKNFANALEFKSPYKIVFFKYYILFSKESFSKNQIRW